MPTTYYFLPFAQRPKRIATAHMELRSICETRLQELTLDLRYGLRLHEELESLSQLAMAPQLLGLHDLAEFARKRDVFLDTGRNASPWTLINFLLRLSPIDPIAYGLPFRSASIAAMPTPFTFGIEIPQPRDEPHVRSERRFVEEYLREHRCSNQTLREHEDTRTEPRDRSPRCSHQLRPCPEPRVRLSLQGALRECLQLFGDISSSKGRDILRCARLARSPRPHKGLPWKKFLETHRKTYPKLFHDAERLVAESNAEAISTTSTLPIFVSAIPILDDLRRAIEGVRASEAPEFRIEDIPLDAPDAFAVFADADLLDQEYPFTLLDRRDIERVPPNTLADLAKLEQGAWWNRLATADEPPPAIDQSSLGCALLSYRFAYLHARHEAAFPADMAPPARLEPTTPSPSSGSPARIPFPRLRPEIPRPNSALREACSRLGKTLPSRDRTAFEIELSFIAEHDLADYFFLLRDIAKELEHSGIDIGMLHGNGMASMVNHLLGLIPLDPAAHDLRMDTFLDERLLSSYPDAIFRVSPENRPKVLETLRSAFGTAQVWEILLHHPGRGYVETVSIGLGREKDLIDHSIQVLDDRLVFPSRKQLRRSGLCVLHVMSDIDQGILDRTLESASAGSEKLMTRASIPLDDETTFERLRCGKIRYSHRSHGMEEDLCDLYRLARDLDHLAQLRSFLCSSDGARRRDHERRLAAEDRRSSIDPLLDPYLRSTYGQLCFEEQRMDIFQELYLLTRREIFDLKRRERTVSDEGTLISLADYLQRTSHKCPHAPPAFLAKALLAQRRLPTKAHMLSLALVDYQLAYLQTHHPEAYAAALAEFENTPRDEASPPESRNEEAELVPPPRKR